MTGEVSDLDEVSYVRDGSYEGSAMVVLEKRGGAYRYVWRGYFDGGNLVRLYPVRPYGGLWDGRRREPTALSVFEIKRDV